MVDSREMVELTLPNPKNNRFLTPNEKHFDKIRKLLEILR